MEQTPSLPGRSPELPSVSPPSTQEAVGAFSNPEVSSGGLVERHEQSARPSGEHAATPPPIVLPAPTVVVPEPDDGTATPVTTVALPTVANDDDLIEKEWVDKAKKVIAETKDDPYRREQEVNRLQADYLSKRYGRELGTPQ